MHWVGTRSKGNTFGASVRSGTGLLAVHHVGGDSQQGKGGTGILVDRQLFQFFAEIVNEVYSQVVHTVVIIAEAGE